MKGTTMMMLVLLASQFVLAQSKTATEITEKKMERLSKKLNLSQSQEQSISAIVLESTNQILAIREQEPNDTAGIKAVKKSSRKLIMKELTPEQKGLLKEQNKIRKKEKTGKKERKQEMLDKRASFESVLSAEEKAIVASAKALRPAKMSKEQRGAMSAEAKEERKAAMKEIRTLLSPVVKNHEAELQQILQDVPSKEGKQEKKKKGKAIQFLLM